VSPAGKEIDPQSIVSAGDGIVSAAQRIRNEVSMFQAELAGFGQPWGNDDLGSLIGMVYESIAELAMDCYNTNTDEIDEIGGLTRMMGANYLATEQNNTDQANRYRQILG
jgi:hypothetical protein